MFKLESYITPILLSYVDKYIKNFRPEDSQVSLWGGDASFHNLDLRLEVLEQELQLPFSFVSGHIHELLIHVPWTKLASEPITITINTIECILKLKGEEESSLGSDVSNQKKEKSKKTGKSREEVETPPGYIQSLINKIVSNIRIYCNNVILKYVEEDIVLSMNVKLLTFESANEKWESAYTELSPTQVVLRKLITLNDLTLCLDKRNAAGKIDVYQEPMLYRCSLTMHLLINYHSATAKRASTTRLDVYCNKMEFSMTEQQVPMLVRLLALVLALQQKEFKPDVDASTENINPLMEMGEISDIQVSWAGWAWSFVPSILPSAWDEDWNREQEQAQSGHTLQIGFYVDNASVTFKVSETTNDRGYYSQHKLKYWPLLALHLQGIYSETVLHGVKWLNANVGVSEAILVPVGYCSCAFNEVHEGDVPPQYLSAGSVSSSHKTDSLFDAEAVENKGLRRSYNISWDYHMATVTEAVLLERTPAFALDYLHQLEIPDDITSEKLSELGSDLEYSNLSERSVLRVVVGPLKLRFCSGFFHRISSLNVAALAYEYAPYKVPKSEPSLVELLPPSEEDYDALNEGIPTKTMQITIFAPVLEFQLMDHPYFVPVKGNLFRKRKKISVGHQTSQGFHHAKKLPKVTLECQCIDLKLCEPIYTNRLIYTTCQLPAPPKHMFEACYSDLSLKIIGFCSRLVLSSKRHTTIITPCGASFRQRNILKPQYWTNPDIPHEEITFESECLTITGTKAKMLIVAHILDKLLKMDVDDALTFVLNSTLLHDAARDVGMTYLEFCLEGLRFKKVSTCTTITMDMSLGSIKAFILEPIEFCFQPEESRSFKNSNEMLSPRKQFFSTDAYTKEIQQVLFISGPEPSAKSDHSGRRETKVEELPPLFTATIQIPINPDVQPHASILIFNLQEMRICVDPLLCRWLMYSPKYMQPASSRSFDPYYYKHRSIAEGTGSAMETPRRAGTPHESIHSNSEREQLHVPPPSAKAAKEEEPVDLQERVYNFLKKWFNVWRGMLICGDIAHCTIYFPVHSLSAIGSQGIQQAIDEALKRELKPEILVLTLPRTSIRSAAQKRGLANLVTDLPVKLPENIWTMHKPSFPWSMTVSDLSCYTLQYGQQLHFLKPVTLSATVGLSTRSSKEMNKSTPTAKCNENIPLPSGIAENTMKVDVGSLGVCVHIDMTPISVSVSEVQVCLVASILYGLTEIVNTLTPEKSAVSIPSPEILPPVMFKSSSSPTVLKESTLNSSSAQTMSTEEVEKEEGDNVKLTAWIQWTITRFTVDIYAHNDRRVADRSQMCDPTLKLVLEAEDIVSSLDFQSVYLKIKSKMGSANIQHFVRTKSTAAWKPGPFLGHVMITKEDLVTDRQEDTSLLSITITRASCRHTHTLWGAIRKNKQKEKKEPRGVLELEQSSHYITEVVVNLQPVDFVLPMATLHHFYVVLQPIMQLPTQDRSTQSNKNDFLMQLNSQMLPLAYLECRGLRFVVPSAELGGRGGVQDVFLFQIDRISLNPSAVNPICRTPCRPDIYQYAAQARILNVPGSEVEDRQYQLDIIGMSLNTGIWEELDTIFNSRTPIDSQLKITNENPALEWNSLGKNHRNTPNLHLWPVINKLDLSVVAAPALVYKKDTIVCGHSMEVNFITDIEINLSLGQIRLASAILTEFLNVFEPSYTNGNVQKQLTIVSPYTKLDMSTYDLLLKANEEFDASSIELAVDSGFETSDFISTSVRTRESISAQAVLRSSGSERSASVFQKQSSSLPLMFQNVPVDLLVVAGKITFVLYHVEKTFQKYKRSKDKKKLASKESFQAEKEKGYEASEEGSVDEKHHLHEFKRFEPLLFICVCQPNIFISRQQLSNSIQFSCFNTNVKISDANHTVLKTIPREDDFAINLIETKPGVPHPDTGVLPAFFTCKLLRGLAKPAALDVHIARPTRILCSTTRWDHIKSIKDKVIQNFTSLFEESRNKTIVQEPPVKKSTEISKFKQIKQQLQGITDVNVKLAQLVLFFKASAGPETTLSFGSLESHLRISNRPERIANVLKLDRLTLSVGNDSFKKLLLNPWSVSVEICLYWEAWQNSGNDPQVQITVDSDCVILDVSLEQIKCVEAVVADVTEFVGGSAVETAPENGGAKIHFSSVSPMEKEQHYKDDLRAGAFQFVDATTNNPDELPLPYQVMFWSQNIAAMAWRYPQPRALTKVRVFPVPFAVSADDFEEQQVMGRLEYWSDCHGCYMPYTDFAISESDISHLELPEGKPKPAVSCTWRVVLGMKHHKNKNLDFDISKVVISPRVLAACMRIDSYFNKNLIPNFNIAIQVSKISVTLYNNFDKTLPVQMPDALKLYICDMAFPGTQGFLTLNVDNVRAYLTIWDFESVACDTSSTISCSVLDYTYLTQQTFLEPFTSKVLLSLADGVSVSFLSKPVHFRFGPCIAHTLAVSAQMWEQSSKTARDSVDLIIMTHYVVCNDTNIHLRFGQVGTDEDILLPSRVCHLYCWRSQKCKQLIRVGLERKRWFWLNPIRVDQEGTQLCHVISDESIVVAVTVKNISATQKQITFSGQLIICNMLVEHFEVKVVRNVKEERDKEFKQTVSHIISGQSTPPSMLVDMTQKYFLRLRFFGLESAWSGDIPLMENAKCAQPWLVKVPLQEYGHFLSVWCRIVTQEVVGGSKVLVMLWPLFMIRSNLPINSKVHIETPTLNVHLESTVKGRGEYQQLYCPGTIDHSHQLSFKFNSSTPTTNPYVPLNYSLVDQKQFFKKSENEDISDILTTVNNFHKKSKWPFFGDELDDIEWIADEEQPLTHVQVRYQNTCQHSSALLVELLPWCLLVNTLGCPIAMIVNEKELCRVCHHGIITPPKLEETFHIGVGIGGTWNVSPPLQLAKSDWSQTFYMPKITGTIPLEGNIKTAVKYGANVCMVSITSTVSNEIRLLKVSSSHVLTNHLNAQVQVICFAVSDGRKTYEVPESLFIYSFAVAPHMEQNKSGVSILQWHVVDSENDMNTDYVLYLAFATTQRKRWSCPIRVDKSVVRKSLVIQNEKESIPLVLTSHEYKGQTFLALHYDTHPQMLIENKCGSKLYCSQYSNGETKSVVADCEHFNWILGIENDFSTYYTMPKVCEKFPDLVSNGVSEKIVFSVNPKASREASPWSTPVDITNYNDQFVRIPFFGDIKVNVIDAVHTILIVVESVSQVEISARDIRGRLILHENESSSNITSKKAETNEQTERYKIFRDAVSDTTFSSSYFTAEETAQTVSETAIHTAPRLSFGLPPLMEQSNMSVLKTLDLKPRWSDMDINDRKLFCISSQSLHQISTIPMRRDWALLRINSLISSITLTLTLDFENGGEERTEIANFCCENFAVTVVQREMMQVCVSISDIQLDNQLFVRDSFDFPVLLINQESKEKQETVPFNTSVSQWIESSTDQAVVRVNFNIETWRDVLAAKNITDVKEIKITVEPLSLFIEDVYVIKLMEYFKIFALTNLIIWPEQKTSIQYPLNSILVGVPEVLIWESIAVAKPLSLRSFSIEPLSILLSVHASVKMYIALDKSPLQFGRFERRRVLTTPYRLGHALTMHYLSGAIFGAGWVVGSLELLGSPGGLARAMGTGLRDFINLPYQGLIQGPWAFLRGITHGSASLMKHVTAGTLQSVTKLASSVARNLDRLTMDEEHVRRTEEQRRQRPQGVTQGFLQGLTGLGISLLGAVGGIAHHPLQSVMADGASPRSLAAGVGLGLVGVITKPLSGAAELVALTGQGLLQGAGWNPLPELRMNPVLNHMYSSTNSILKYNWKFVQLISQNQLLYVTEATCISNFSQYEAVALILTSEALVIINTDEDVSHRVISLSELKSVENASDPTLLSLKICAPVFPALQNNQEECAPEMDPACRARVADYVRNTAGLLLLSEDLSPEQSEMSISPLLTPSHSVDGNGHEQLLTFYVNPQNRNYFLSMFSFAKQQRENHSFSVM